MSTKVIFTDDEHETVFISVNEEVLAELSHDEYGWAGMEKVMTLIKDLSDTFGFDVLDYQDIV